MSDTDPGLSRLAQQETWRKQLARAETEYHRATEELRLALVRKNQAGAANGVDVSGAAARKTAARAEYVRVLRIFTDLVLRGKSPASDS